MRVFNNIKMTLMTVESLTRAQIAVLIRMLYPSLRGRRRELAFRQSFKVIPGLRLNLSRSGLSASIGGAPLTLNIGPHGLTGTASIPGTGVSFRQHVGFGSPDAGRHPAPQAPAHGSREPNTFPIAPELQRPAAPVEVVRSASTELLTSDSLREVKRILEMARVEFEDITRALHAAQREKSSSVQRYESWRDGFLLKRLFKKQFVERRESAETATAKVGELEEQRRLTTVATHIEIDREQAEPFFRMRDDFAALVECVATWDVKSHQATDKFHERTTADLRIDRARVAFDVGGCDLLQWEQRVPHLRNSKGAELFLSPGFIVYRAAKVAFSVIAYHDVRATTSLVQFQETETVPRDSKVVGQTWAKANKDGTRDKRFAQNYQIPIALYGRLELRSDSGLWEEFQFSDPERMMRFEDALNRFVRSFN